MKLTFINSPAKLVFLAVEHEPFATAWTRFQASGAELLVVRRPNGELDGLAAEELEALLPGALAATVGKLALKPLSVLSHRVKLAEVLAELSRGAEGVMLTNGPNVVSVVMRSSHRGSRVREAPLGEIEALREAV